MKRVMIGFNGNAQSHDALALGFELAPDDAEIVVASVRADPLLTGRPEPEGEEPWAAELRKVAEAVAGGRKFTFEAAIDTSAARALHVMAREHGSDLLVLGSTARGRLGAVTPGRTADRLLHAGPCAIAVAPLGYANGSHGSIETIGVAVDESPTALRAVEQAAAEAVRLGAALKLVTAVPPVVPAGPTTGNSRPLVEEAHADASRALARALDRVPGGVDASGEVLDGNPVNVLVDQSEAFDLLFMGSRGYGPVGHVILGTVSSKVIREARCPVLVISRHADTEQVRVRRLHAGAAA